MSGPKSWGSLIKNKAVYYKGGACQLCGYNRHNGALEFHYIISKPTDTGSPVNRNSPKSWQIVKEKLDRCILVCANCRREIHNGVHDERSLANLLEPNGQEDWVPPDEAHPAPNKTMNASTFPHWIEWPPVEDVVQMLKESTYKRVADELGVAAVSVRRFLIRNGVDPKSLGKRRGRPSSQTS